MSKTMLYHWPAPLPAELTSGSRVHAVRMLEAFREIGYEVEVVTGDGRRRAELAQKIKRDCSRGRRFDFVFSESLAIPTLLTERHHLPTHPWVDFNLFRWLRSRGTPVGLFYGDVYWRFPHLRYQHSWPRRVVLNTFYWYDVLQYRRTLDHLFIPSLRMAEWLPVRWPAERLSALLPGCTTVDLPEPRRTPGQGGLRLLYVGGVTPPLYDLTPLFDATRSLEGVSLTVCCRAAEWETARAKYGVDTGADLQIVHTSGRGLDSLYAEADLFSMALGLDAYRAVTVPVKLLECLGYGVPVVAIGESETARLIAEEGVGWVVNSVEEFRALLASLRDDPSPIAAKRQRIAEVRPRHTWAARAQGVADTLTGLRVVA